MAFGDGAADNPSVDPKLNGADIAVGADKDEDEDSEIDTASTELPAFLTDDEPSGVALNGASAP